MHESVKFLCFVRHYMPAVVETAIFRVGGDFRTRHVAALNCQSLLLHMPVIPIPAVTVPVMDYNSGCRSLFEYGLVRQSKRRYPIFVVEQRGVRPSLYLCSSWR
jgi:hypothetical protein